MDKAAKDTIIQMMRVGGLIGRYYGKTINADEEEELMKWLATNKKNRDLFERLADENIRNHALSETQMYQQPDTLPRLLEQWQENADRKRGLGRSVPLRLVAMIALLIAVASAILLWNISREKGRGRDRPIAVNQDISAGSRRATLVLAGGGTMSLVETADTAIISHGTLVARQSNGILSYINTSNDHTPIPMEYNTLYTPKGGEYHLQLADGTGVWLNAGSSIRFPTTFSGMERKVEISGEVFFDVARVSDRPFIVAARRTEVQVLGTAFNVKAYSEDSAVYTTLVSGSVKIKAKDRQTVLRPGHMAISGSESISIEQADIAEITAWKDGLFIFNEVDISTLMSQVARWYDVGVEFAPGFRPGAHFTGKISRQVPLNELLDMISLTAVAKFKVEDRKIVVSN